MRVLFATTMQIHELLLINSVHSLKVIFAVLIRVQRSVQSVKPSRGELMQPQWGLTAVIVDEINLLVNYFNIIMRRLISIHYNLVSSISNAYIQLQLYMH